MKQLRYLLMAALVALPLTACDEDNDPVVEVTVYGTVTGTVSAEGDGLAGVAVTLVGATSQSASTGAGGSYTFTNVEAGSYGIAIDASSHPDVSFPVTSKTTNIVTQGETKTVDFTEGSYIRTAAIVGTVTADGAPLGGVAVAVTGGPDNITDNSVTDAAGAYAATGLRAGDYTVTITPPDGVEFASTSAAVTVTTGGTKTANFPGDVTQLASIAGTVVVDDQGRAGVAVELIMGGATIAETESGAGGVFGFANLMPGEYTVSITAPEGITFTTTSKTKTLAEGEVWNVNFAGFSPAEPATISIQSITKGGGPVNLEMVSGQIEITLNITRNDQTLDYVDVLIGNVVVATQDFAEGNATPAEMVDETVTLNVPTTQVKWAENGWTPAVLNGGNEISANLYVVEGDQPIPTNKVPVVMQNYDAMIPGNDPGGNLTFTPDEPDRVALNGTDVWYAGSATFKGVRFLAYSTHTPSEVAFDSDCGGPDTQTIVGDYTTGIMVWNTYECAGVEIFGVEPQWWDFYVDYDSYVGPDGTAVEFYDDCDYEGDCMSALGAEFYLGDGTIGPRRFVIMDPVEGQIEDADELNIDNKAPEVCVDGQVDACVGYEDAPSNKVAFNDDFSQWWVKGDYDFVAHDVFSADYGVQGVTEQAFLWVQGDPGSCTGIEVTTPAGTPLAETVVSDGDPDGYQICGYAEDALGNGAYTSYSNWFGVDMVAPQARIHGDDGSDALAAGTAPIGDAEGTTPVSPDFNETVYGTVDMVGMGDFHYADLDATMAWGLDAIDDRSGLETNGTVGFPFVQTVTHDGVVPAGETVGEDGYGAILSDNWVRVDATTPFLNGIDLPGIYVYEGYAVDRAGNMSQVFTYNWLLDNDGVPTTSAITPVGTDFTVGAPAMFNVWGSDDLEIMELTFFMNYPTAVGDVWLNYGAQAVAADRWDSDFMNLLAAAQYGTSTVWGRIDFTNADGTIPGTMADGVDALPTAAVVELTQDAGYNPGDGSQAAWTFLPYNLNGWTNYTDAPWPDENLDSFTITDTGTEYEVLHVGDSSIDETLLDAVLLVVYDPNTTPGTVSVCASTTSYVGTDNGTNRFYTYTFDYPDEGPCAAANAPLGASIHAVGVKGDALLVTNDFTIVPNPAP